MDGGTVNGLKSAYAVETNDFTLPEPTKTGFTFKGWTGSNGSTPQKNVTVSKGSSGTKSYKANWEGIAYTYTVAYRSTSGKSLGSTTVQGFLGDTKTVALPAKTGYKTPDNVSVVFDTVGSKTVTVTYEPINYNISFVKNGGTYSEPAIQYNIESNEIVLGNAYMAGTGFLGWYDNASFNGSRILSIPTGSTGNKTFYAKFSVDSYSITYYLGEGTMNGGLTTYTVNTTTFNLPTPTKTGYTFKGWTGTGLSGNTMTVTIPQGSTGDREYTAHWEVNEYTYTFRYLSSTGKQLGSTTITNQFQEGEMVTPPDYAGYTTPAKQSVIWDSTTPKTIDFTYPIITYNISYDLNGGTASGLKTTYTVEDAQFRLPTPTKTGSSWQGWTGTGITEKRLSFSIPTGSTGNKEFYANWERNSYTYSIKYVSSSGKSLGTSSVSNYYGSTQTVSAPAKTGYNTPSSQSVKWDSTSAKTITFTYTPITYTISYNLNGGSISGQPTAYTIESNTITLPTPTDADEGFVGWYQNSVFSGSQVVQIPSGSTGNKTFYAKWDSIYWGINSSNKLILSDQPVTSAVSGKSGKFSRTKSFSHTTDNSVPWRDYRSDITSVEVVKINKKISPTSTSYWFYSMEYITNIDVTNLDTSNVVSMEDMFSSVGWYATSVTINGLSGWNTSNVTNMGGMFYQIGAFKATSVYIGNLSRWNTSNVTDMTLMFSGAAGNATSFTISGLSGWNTSNVRDMMNMFMGAGKNASYRLDLSSWNVSKVYSSRHAFFNERVESKVIAPAWVS